MKKNRLFYFFAVLLGFLGFYFKSKNVLDADLGWHIRMGEYILKNGIPRVDPFSYTMPSFHFIDHEWLANVLIYLLNSYNPNFLYFLFAALSILTPIISYYPKKLELFQLSVFVFSSAVLISFAGIRIQVVDWLFFALLLRLVFEEKLWIRFRFLLPILILVWTNLHGGFAIAFLLLVIFYINRFIEKKLSRADVLVFVACFIATLINPYGIRLYSEVLFQAGNIALRWQISEWVPGVFYLNFSLIFIAAISLVFLKKYHTSLKRFYLVVYLIFMLLAVMGIRNIPFFIIVNLFIFPVLFNAFEKHLKKPEQKKRLTKVGVVVLVISFMALFYEVGLVILQNNYSEKALYPKGAVVYLKENKPSGRIFSEYDWGGYLIWRLPEQKVFVDGRMPSWYWRAPVGESDSAFSDYNLIIKGGDSYEKLFKKYNISVVLLKKPIYGKVGILEKIERSLVGRIKSLESRLMSDKWKKKYEDGVSVLYEKD